MSLASQRHSRRESSGDPAKPVRTLQRPRRPAKKSAVAPAASVESQNREQMIAEAAYFRAAQRNFESGRELDDWLVAELEIDSLNPAHQESIDDASIIAPIP